MKHQLHVGAGLFLCFILWALVLPHFLAHDPSTPSHQVLAPPSRDHLLGTTDLGQDVLAQLVRGTLPTLAVFAGAGAGTVAISFLLGTLAALKGGLLDRMILRFADIMLALPSLVAMLMISAVVLPGTGTLILVLILFEWPGDVRVFRAKILEEKSREPVDAARTFGAKQRYLIRRHYLPEAWPLLVVRFVQSGRRAVLKMAGLTFLGLTDPHMISWGSMLHHGMAYLGLDAWKWWVLPPAAALALVLASLYLLGTFMEHRAFLQ